MKIIDNQNTCPECGGEVFEAIPGETTIEKIRQFYRRKGIKDHDDEWIHPGTYCTSCDWGILAEYPLPSRVSIAGEAPDFFRIRLVNAGMIDRIHLMAAIRKINPLSTSELKALLDGTEHPIIGTIRSWQRDEVRKIFQRMGAEVEMIPEK